MVARFFALTEQNRLDGKGVRLTDINRELINTYQMVRDRVETLIALLRRLRTTKAFTIRFAHLSLHSSTKCSELRGLFI